MKILKSTAIIIICSFFLTGATCVFHWNGGDDADNGDDSNGNSETVISSTSATVQSINTINNEAVVITDEDVEFTIQLPADPVVVVNDIVEIEITFEGTDGEFVITDVVFVGIVL